MTAIVSLLDRIVFDNRGMGLPIFFAVHFLWLTYGSA